MRVVAVFMTVLLGGCYQLDGVSSDVDYEMLFAATTSCSRSPGEAATPDHLMIRGFTDVYAACEGFFNSATKAQQDAFVGNKTLDAAQIATIAILGATASPAAAAKAITITAAGVVLAKEIINQSTNTYAFNTHLYKVRELTRASMASYKASALTNPPANYCLAYNYVVEYATLCSISSMKLLLDQQVAISSSPVGSVPVVEVAQVVNGETRSGARGTSRSGSLLRYRAPLSMPSTSFVVRPN